jgi:sterol desaturase/sphingolipid hydroxylase (fatty acid hydroxylase superfamily)
MSTIITSTELKKIGMVTLSMCILAHIRRKTIQARWLERDQTPKSLVDHPVIPYLIENSIIIGCAILAEKVVSPPDRSKPLLEFFKFYLRGMLLVEPGLLAQKILCKYVYSHVPYFSKQKPPGDVWTMFTDWLYCNFPAGLFNCFMQVSLLMAMPDEMYEKVRNPPPFTLSSFLPKMLIARLAVDASFGLVHKAMHDYSSFYKSVHARHHGHRQPRTQTNFHFEAIDIFLEAIFPLYCAQTTLMCLGMGPTRTEQMVLFSTLIYYESASHSGKELPPVTWFPMLSPLIGGITGCDEDLILYHTRHHQLLQCNYSISPWWDKYVTGTYKIELPEGYDNTKSYENS